jgi:uncharacterized protein (TIRG00374 family)
MQIFVTTTVDEPGIPAAPMPLSNAPDHRVARRRRSALSTALKAALSIGLLAWLLARVDPRNVYDAFSAMPLPAFFGSLALYMVATAVGALKWLVPVADASYRLLLKLTFVAQFYAILLPGQIAGEVVKAHKLAQAIQDPPRSISAVLFDRITGWIALLAVGLLGLFLTRAAGAEALKTWFLVALAALVAGLGLLRLPGLRRPVDRLAERPPAAFAGAAKSGRWLLAGLAAWREYTGKPAVLTASLGLGLVFHLLGAGIFRLLSLGLGIEVGVLDWCWVFAALSLILLLPVAVGGLGLREGGLVVMLGWLGVPAEKALAVSLAFFGLQAVGAAIGAVLEWRGPK